MLIFIWTNWNFLHPRMWLKLPKRFWKKILYFVNVQGCSVPTLIEIGRVEKDNTFTDRRRTSSISFVKTGHDKLKINSSCSPPCIANYLSQDVLQYVPGKLLTLICISFPGWSFTHLLTNRCWRWELIVWFPDGTWKADVTAWIISRKPYVVTLDIIKIQ